MKQYKLLFLLSFLINNTAYTNIEDRKNIAERDYYTAKTATAKLEEKLLHKCLDLAKIVETIIIEEDDCSTDDNAKKRKQQLRENILKLLAAICRG